MTPEQMRELADELDMYVGSPTRASYYPSPVLRAADFLRQCAEQRPDGWKLVPVEPTPEMLSAVGMMYGYDWHAPGCSPDADHANWYSAMIDAAPTAPQAEQPIDLDAVAMQQMRQAAAESTWMPSEYTSNDWIADVCRWLRDGPPAAAPQAEPSAALIRAYNSGYMQGHHDTVEAQFIVIHPLDMDTYHADVVAELGLTAAPQAEPMADSDADYWLRNRQPILDAIERAGFVLMSNASGFWLHPRGTTEAQIKARDALLDFISENGTASEGVQYYLDRYVRAALAAKDRT